MKKIILGLSLVTVCCFTLSSSTENKANNEKITIIATIPSRETLLTMFAAGIMQPIKEVAIALDLHIQNLEEGTSEEVSPAE